MQIQNDFDSQLLAEKSGRCGRSTSHSEEQSFRSAVQEFPKLWTDAMGGRPCSAQHQNSTYNMGNLFVKNKCGVATSSTEQITLNVTPGLELPAKPLACTTTKARISNLAGGNIVDEGGMSSSVDQMLNEGHPHGFIAAVTAAFADHYPLALRPQHFWLMISQGVATHVDLNAQALRSNWVAHQGKKTLEVCCDEFRLGQPNDWQSVVSSKPDSFSAQIAANTLEGVADALSPPFSSTTETEDIAQKITIMDICKNYFSYKCSTCCGFPEITLEGTGQDWQLLRVAAEQLLQRCDTEWASEWASALMPLLDKLAEARSGQVDPAFWNSMCKRGGTSGSGSRTWFNGWVNILFPYIDRSHNRYCVAYNDDAAYVKEGLVWNQRYGMSAPAGVQGPDCADFGSGLSSAPVEWDYNGQSIKLEFNSGFIGAVQCPETLQIRPQVGWYITRAVRESQKQNRFG